MATTELDDVLEAERANLLELTSELVRTNSMIPPDGDERAIVDLVRERADQLGLGRGEISCCDESRPNLILRVPGTGDGPTLMLNGHLDTKPVGDAGPLWRTDPFEPTVVDGRLFGLGTSDMKAAVAAMLYAAHALVRTGTPRGDLLIVLVADEEAGANYGSRFLAPTLAGQADACLIGEPSGWEHDWQGLHVLSRGICCFRIRVRGTQMHSSLSDRMPSVNAVQKMAEVLLRLPREVRLDHPPHTLDDVAPTLNTGVTASGGVFYGVVPGEAEFRCDLRTVPGMTHESVDAALRGWIARAQEEDPSLRLELEYEPTLTWVPSAQIDLEHPLVAAARHAAAHVLGTAPPTTMFPGTTDAPWFDQAGIPTIPSFGPGILTYCHGPNEFVTVEAIQQAARIYAHTAAGYRAA